MVPFPMTIGGRRSVSSIASLETTRVMKAKTRHRKSYKWRKRCDSSPIAKGRRAKIHGMRNPRKAQAFRWSWPLTTPATGVTSGMGTVPGCDRRPGQHPDTVEFRVPD